MSRTFFALSCLAASAAAGTLAFSAPAAARTVTVAVSASFTSLDPYDPASRQKITQSPETK